MPYISKHVVMTYKEFVPTFLDWAETEASVKHTCSMFIKDSSLKFFFCIMAVM